MGQLVHMGSSNGLRFFKRRCKRRKGAPSEYRILVAPTWTKSEETDRDAAFEVGAIEQAARGSQRWLWIVYPSHVRAIQLQREEGQPWPVLRGWQTGFEAAADEAMQALTVYLAQHGCLQCVVEAAP